MDLASSKFYQPPSLFESDGEPPLEPNSNLYGNSKNNPFADAIADPLCRLNLRETSEFVKSLPMANNSITESAGIFEVPTQRRREGVNSVTQRRFMEAPSTPGRPVFGFSIHRNFSRKSVPSKWDDAEKWLICSPCHDSPAHSMKLSEPTKITEQFYGHKAEGFAEKSTIPKEKEPEAVTMFPGPNDSLRAVNVISVSSDVLLKDKFMDDVEANPPNYRHTELSKEGFLFENSASDNFEVTDREAVHEAQHRDIGTEMTPLGSSTTSRCPTPFKSISPARHNTPTSMSGPLALGNSSSSNGSALDISQFQKCHLAKLELGHQYDSVACNWSSREEEEEDISKSLRHSEAGNECRKSVLDSRVTTWEEEKRTECCLRYQREEAKIQAWVNLQTAKAEAQSRKLEVKIQKMRLNLEEKLMKRMTVVHRKAEEMGVAAGQQHLEQIRKTSEEARKMVNRNSSQFSGHGSCACFPCNNNS